MDLSAAILEGVKENIDLKIFAFKKRIMEELQEIMWRISRLQLTTYSCG